MSSSSSSGRDGHTVATDLTPLLKIVVGIDYGTTYSGISYGVNCTTDITKIDYLSSWPGAPLIDSKKTPTRIAYASENPDLTSNQWGYGVKPNLLSCSWTKLFLDENALPTEYDDRSFSKIVDSGMMRLPMNRNAHEVSEDFLRGLYLHFVKEIQRKITPEVYDVTPLDCWITLPAIWSDQAKHATLHAAKRSGFGSRNMDQIHTITEPEAAAIAVLKELAAPETLNGVQCEDNILICDCGGGTVDITTYKVTSVAPVLKFEELCAGIGGKCGSTYLDRGLHSLMSDRFRKAFDKTLYSKKGPGSKFMDSWENLKRDFGHNMEDHGFAELGPLHLDVPNGPYFDKDEHAVRLSQEDMKSIFDPVVKRVLNLVKQQVTQAHDDKQAKIHRIVLVGGLGSSKYLFDALSKWCSENGNIQLLCPANPQTAVVRGAAIRGLEGITPRLKFARRHYGFSVSLKFREGVDDERNSYICEFDNGKYCSGRVVWGVSKILVIVRVARVYTPGEAQTFNIRLYSCGGNSQPERVDALGVEEVGKIRSEFPADFSFGNNCEDRFNPRLQKTVHQFYFEVHIIFGDKGANLKFKTVVGGNIISDATIEFPEH